MVNRLLLMIFIASFLLAPKLQWSMEQKYGYDPLDDDYVDRFSIVLRWPEEQKDSFLTVCTQAEKSKTMAPYPEDDPIGFFDGDKKVVVTFFDEGYMKITSFKKFKRLFLMHTYLGCHKLTLQPCQEAASESQGSVIKDGGPKKQKLKKTKSFLTRVIQFRKNK